MCSRKRAVSVQSATRIVVGDENVRLFSFRNSQDDLAYILPRVNITVSLGRLFDGERLADHGLHFSGGVHSENFFELPAKKRFAACHAAEVNANDRQVFPHQREGIEARHAAEKPYTTSRPLGPRHWALREKDFPPMGSMTISMPSGAARRTTATKSSRL